MMQHVRMNVMMKDALVLARIVLKDIRAGKRVPVERMDTALANIEAALKKGG